ncbi:class II peroxidase [Cylindrobasidium torrendii FP15055 ss-10]|uniref:Peroxidase n=1 Tax=Cylindrobasidium torrendii FP15055 ss-10 TaxID=1314674 RepID=A0A0D7BBN1_9AGAR|nr:class II peroxidase [Cylindrobasidium torrendii FP15055 ss-10]
MSFQTTLRRARAPIRAAALASAPRSATFARAAFRRYSTEPEPPKKGNTALYIGLTAAALGVGAYFIYTSDESPLGVKATYVPTREDYQKVYNRIAEIIESASDAGYDDGSYGPVLLRLAWHSSGTYDEQTKTGGSNYATMRFNPESGHGANAGLDVARNLMEGVKKEFPWISYGDLWTLAGVAAIQEMAGPKVPWRPGRVDGFTENCTPDGRLPDAAQGADHVRAIFYRMGFNDQEIVALSGAHALGRCHTNRSGFDGPWTFSPTTVTNDYYKLLFEESWVWRKWNGPKQLQDKKTKSLMMLPTDYVLVQDKSFKKYAKAYADNQDLFFKDFAAAVARLFELGVPTNQFSEEPYTLKSTLD